MKELHAKGWLKDVYDCVDRIAGDTFTLDDVYRFEGELSRLHPGNNHVQDKVRQQLQFLRDRGYLEFLGDGCYRKL